MYASFFCCFFHCCCNLFQFFHRKAFLNDKGAGQIQRFCTHAGKVIDGSTDGQFSDISTREKCRGHDKSVCGYCHSSCWRNQYRRIVCGQIGVCKMCFKHLIDQFRCLFSPGTMCHCNCFIFHYFFLLSIYFTNDLC